MFEIKGLAEVLPNGYRPFTTFYQDLSIADHFGKDAIQDTYNNVARDWLSDYKYFTEFVLCLNLKCWEWYETGNHELSSFYSDLYYMARDLAYDNFTEEEAAYLFRTLD